MERVTLSQYIAELEKLRAQYGDFEIAATGGSSGTVHGMHSPHVLIFADKNDTRAYIPAWADDIGKTAVH